MGTLDETEAGMGRAVKMTQPVGDPFEILTIVEVKKPSPGPGEVLVRMKVRPVNPSDTSFMRVGRLAVANLAKVKYTPTEYTVPGFEGYGIVEEVGEGVTRFKPGQRVVPFLVRRFLASGTCGSWQEYVVIDEDEVYAISDSIDDSTAAQFVSNPWSAYALVKTLAAPPGEYIISTAAGSAFGRVVIQLAKHWGMKTINIVRHDGYTQQLKALGADVVINSSTEDMVAKVMELTDGKGAYGALDAVGGTLTKTVASCVRDEGQILVYGFLGGYEVTIGTMDLARKLKLSWWVVHPYTDSLAKRKLIGNDLLRLFEEKVLAPMPSASKFKLEDFKSAIAAAEKMGVGGNKVLLTD